MYLNMLFYSNNTGQLKKEKIAQNNRAIFLLSLPSVSYSLLPIEQQRWQL